MPEHQPNLRSPKPIRGGAALVAVLILASSCSASGDANPPTTKAPQSDPAESVVSVITAAEATAPDTTAAEPAAGWRELVAPTCEVLGSRGFESRRDALATYDARAEQRQETDLARADLVAACGSDVEAIEAGIAVAARRDALDAETSPVAISGLACADGEYRFVATNQVDHAVGVHVAFRLFVGADEEATGSADYPIVIWNLAPGGQQGITGEFHVPNVEDGFRCNVLARVFDASTDDGDAAMPGETDPALTGDDPATWFGALLGREVDAVGSGDPDAAAVTEDLRSMFYDNVLALNVGDEAAERIPTSVKICAGSVDRPTPDRLSFVYFVTYPTADSGVEGLLRHGLFRRGDDEQWRWLSAAHYFDSPDFWSCGRPGLQG